MFVAHWCPNCIDQLSILATWDSGTTPPVRVIAVSTAVDPSGPNYPPSTWFANNAWPWPVIADDDQSAGANAFGMQGLPYYVLVGADGTVKMRASGKMAAEDLTALAQTALGG